MSDFEDQMIELEQSVREKYHMDPVFHAKVQMAARVIEANMRVEGEAERRDALRTALVILAIAEESVEDLRLRSELAHQTARAEYFRYAPEIEFDPEGVKRLRDDMRASRAALPHHDKDETP